MTLLCEDSVDETRAPYEGEFIPLGGKFSFPAWRPKSRGKLRLTALWMSFNLAMIRCTAPLREGELLSLELPLAQGQPVRIRAWVTDVGVTRSGEVATLELATPAQHRESLEHFLQARRAG